MCTCWLVCHGVYLLACVSWCVLVGLCVMVCTCWLVCHGVYLLACVSWCVLVGLCVMVCTCWIVTFTESDVFNALQRLDTAKAMGMDGIGPNVLKHCALGLCEPLHRLFTTSIRHHSIPRFIGLHRSSNQGTEITSRELLKSEQSSEGRGRGLSEKRNGSRY